MHEYQLTVPHECEALLLGIRLTLAQNDAISQCTVMETKDATVFFAKFKNKNEMNAFDKEMRKEYPFLF